MQRLCMDMAMRVMHDAHGMVAAMSPNPASTNAYRRQCHAAWAGACTGASDHPRTQCGRWDQSGTSGHGCQNRRCHPAQFMSSVVLSMAASMDEVCSSHQTTPHLASTITTTLASLVPLGTSWGRQVAQLQALSADLDHQGPEGLHSQAPGRGRHGPGRHLQHCQNTIEGQAETLVHEWQSAG
jgi:hypothetical protein